MFLGKRASSRKLINAAKAKTFEDFRKDVGAKRETLHSVMASNESTINTIKSSAPLKDTALMLFKKYELPFGEDDLFQYYKD